MTTGRADVVEATEREVLGGEVWRIVVDLHQLDPLVRDDVPDAVHQMRVSIRKLRSILKTYASCFDRSVTDPIRVELGWLGAVLGRPRDLEVLRDHLAEVVRADTWIDARLRAEHRGAHDAAVGAMSSDRYAALLRDLGGWRTALPWRDGHDRPAHKRLSRALERACASLQRTAASAAAAPAAERTTALHDVRRAAKRVRYAAEPLVPLLGPDARRKVRAAERLQTTLGKHHDAVVAADETGRLARAALAEDGDAATLGLLRARLEHEAAGHELAFAQEWKKVRKRLQ